jgi:GMP synthase-like glutamine amidotransferase
MTGREGDGAGQTVTIFQHMETEGPGFFPELLRSRGVPFKILRLDKSGEAPPAVLTPLIILGGAMSVHDEKEFPFLAREKEIIRSSLRDGRPVAGICLGAQLIADAAGSRVYPGTREFGWCDVYRENPGFFQRFPDRMKVFQFHSDTFDLPDGAVLLWRGSEVRHQMFLLGSAAGLQFHPEITVPLIREWGRGAPSGELREILARSARLIPPSHALCEELVDRFLLRGMR